MTIQTIHNDESTLKDELKRSALRQAFGEAITNCTPPHVFGLHGEWGSGKTSFLRQLRYELDAPKKSPPLNDLTPNKFGDHIISVWFEAWRYQDEPLPIIALLQEIRRQLEQRSILRTISGQSKKLAEISVRSIMNSFDDVAKLLKLESLSTKGIQNIGETWEKDHLQTKLGTDSIREFLEHAINNLLQWKTKTSAATGKPRLVVIIDDLDRCQPATAFKLLEALKVHLSLPNCIFIIGMNQQTVVEAIANELKRDEKDAAPRLKAEAYLEKLCTNVWRLPLPGTETNLDFFVSLLNDIPVKAKFHENLNNCRCLPQNPRRLKSLANIFNRLWHNLSIEEKAKDKIELITLFYAYIYQFHGDLYRRWQWDHNYFLQIKEFVDSDGVVNAAQKAAGFEGLILPQRITDTEEIISQYPDPSTAGVFWIAPLLQKRGIYPDMRPTDFDQLHKIGL